MRQHKRISLTLHTMAIMALVLCAVGCGPKQKEDSGFLSDYSQLQVDKSMDGARVWNIPDLSLASYDKFLIDPIVVHFGSTPRARGPWAPNTRVRPG